MADRVRAEKSWEMTPTPEGWELTLYEGDIPVGGAGGTDDDYEALIAMADQFAER